jgi:uncharacterized protein (DUF58 family)
MTFSEVTQYQYGDDIRAIDWNVTARYKAHVKVFEEQLTMMLMVYSDQSFCPIQKILLPRLPPLWLFGNTE